MKRDFYDILGLKKGASDNDIKVSYRKLAVKYHPDKNPNNKDAEEKFREATEAYETLKDPNKRRNYDMYGSEVPNRNPFQGFSRMNTGPFTTRTTHSFDGDINVNDFFAQWINRAHSTEQKSSKKKGKDIHITLGLTLSDCFYGTTKTIKYSCLVECTDCLGTGSKSKNIETCPKCTGTGLGATKGIRYMFESPTCSDCNGTGIKIINLCTNCSGKGKIEGEKKVSINIPPGIGSGQKLTLSREGQAVGLGGRNGDLIISIKEIPDDIYRREGANLSCNIDLTISEAVLGTEKTITFLRDVVFKLKVPQGTKSGTIFRLNGKGLPIPKYHNAWGDLLIETRIIIPSILSEKETEIFKNLRQLEINT